MGYHVHSNSVLGCNLPNKSNNPRLMILSLSMLQTKMSYFDARNELHLVGMVDLVKLGQDLASVRGEGDQDGQVGQGHEGNIVLWI